MNDDDSNCETFCSVCRPNVAGSHQCLDRARVDEPCDDDEDCRANLSCTAGACAGGAELGAPCSDDVDCRSGACAGGACAPPPPVVLPPASPDQRAGEGDSCEDLDCAATLFCQNDDLICVLAPLLGDPCPDSQCTTGAFCSDETLVCEAKHPDGDACTDDEQCQSGICPVEGLCKPTGGGCGRDKGTFPIIIFFGGLAWLPRRTRQRVRALAGRRTTAC